MSDEKPRDTLDYSVYVLDARGRIQTMQRLKAASDECAIWLLAKVQFNHAAELWRRGRRIASIGADVADRGCSPDTSA